MLPPAITVFSCCIVRCVVAVLGHRFRLKQKVFFGRTFWHITKSCLRLAYRMIDFHAGLFFGRDGFVSVVVSASTSAATARHRDGTVVSLVCVVVVTTGYHLDELADFEHEVERRILLQEQRVQSIGHGNRVTHAAGQHELLYCLHRGNFFKCVKKSSILDK